MARKQIWDFVAAVADKLLDALVAAVERIPQAPLGVMPFPFPKKCPIISASYRALSASKR
jgi:hypothetical protein